ncbi:ribosome recycling factor [Enterobacteriaceae endosymbiont of Donacia cincticornis]|uniref:ribosome-recycling factor n=1 Tax=Enterobacteriaceae endosymbiont of Donacia cincticornis TaxID=2675773 RepID=UPI00144A09B9|nr:ribosome recycling factor [Enterobacteriaceae endosymbiont of Donacia cincticornis]QJC36111.1 ribosome recycling factor [Enterobacteriaceae endosymbiont of Donacia cincticornis]
MENNIINDNKISMQKCLNTFIKKVNILSQNRLSPYLLNHICLKLNNKLTPINHICSIVLENNSTLKITPFDITIKKNIEKSIILANLDLTTKIIGHNIYVYIPPITEFRKIKIIKNIKTETEQNKINIRNIRRKSNHKIKNLFKNKQINENQEKILYNKIQKQTVFYIKEIQEFFKKIERNFFC